MKLNLNRVDLKISAGTISQFPSDGKPQIAFAGRSNVGKSSLINSLLGRKSLARVSATPGKTITVNFYDIDHVFYLVDLPGYGYAKRSAEEQRRWSALTDGYFTANPSIDKLKLTVCLIDSRIGPTADDIAMFEYLEATDSPFIIVGTKCDKINATAKKEFPASLSAIPSASGAQAILLYSSTAKTGRDELWSKITEYISK